MLKRWFFPLAENLTLGQNLTTIAEITIKREYFMNSHQLLDQWKQGMRAEKMTHTLFI